MAVLVRGRFRPRPVAVHRLELPDAEGLPAVLDRLSGLLPCDPLTVDVALLPPLARTKVLRLPPAGRRDLRRLLEREASRHFLGVEPGPVVADATPLSSAAESERAPCLSVCAPGSRLEPLVEALLDAGFEPALVTSGAVALIEAWRARAGSDGSDAVRLRVRAGEWVEEIRLRGDEPRAVHPTRESAGSSESEDVGARGNGAAAEGGSSPRTVRLRRTPRRASGSDAEELGPEGLAAFGAVLIPGEAPTLASGERRAKRRRREGLRAMTLGVGALLVLGFAAVAHLGGVERELRAVTERRALLSEAIDDARRMRDVAGRAGEIADAVDLAAGSRSSVTALIEALAGALPESAHLGRVVVENDRVRLTGRARSASLVVLRLAEADVFSDVSLESIRSATDVDGGEGEHFRIVLATASESRDDPDVGGAG